MWRRGLQTPADLLRGACRLLGGLLFLLGGLAALGRLRAEALREPLDAAFRIDELLAAREERVAVIADFEVQLRLGRPGVPGRAAGAAGLDLVVLGVNPFLHSVLLGPYGKTKV